MRYKYSELQLAGNKKVRDTRALLDLLNEYHDTTVKMSFTRARSGKANKLKGTFTVPTHAIDNNETYLFYYAIHEFTHCLGYNGHDAAFKREERNLLAKF